MNPLEEWLVPASVHPTLVVTDWMDSEDDKPPDPNSHSQGKHHSFTQMCFFLPTYSMGTETDQDWQLNTN